MSKPAARITDMHACPMVSGVVPHVGGPILPPGAPTVLIGGLPAARVSDQAVCAGGPDVIVMGSFTVLIGGLPAARMGDMTAHGGSIVGGYPTVLIGDSGGGAGSPAGFTMAAARASGAAFTRTDCPQQGALAQASDSAASPEDISETASWIEIALTDDDGKPVPRVRYQVIPPDQRTREGVLDENGFARIGGIEPGQCTILFPDLDGRSWEPRDGGPAGELVAPSADLPADIPSIDPATVLVVPLPVPPLPVPRPGGGVPSVRPESVALRRAARPSIRAGTVSFRLATRPGVKAGSVVLNPVARPSIRASSVKLARKP